MCKEIILNVNNEILKLRREYFKIKTLVYIYIRVYLKM